MALVKKLKGGGVTFDTSDIDTQFSKLGFTGKDERKIRNAFAELTNYLQNTPGAKIEIDPTTKQYTITGEGSERFVGNPEGVKFDWLGRPKIDDKSAISAAVHIYNNLQKNQIATPEIEKDDIDIGDLDEYISTKAYPNATFFKEDLSKLQTNEERQKKIQELMKGRVADYLQNAEQNKETFNFKDVEDVKALKSALEKGDWQDVRLKAAKVNWNIDRYILSEDDLKAIEQDKEVEKQKKALEVYKKAGLSEDLQNQLYTEGYTDIGSDWAPEGLKDPKNVLSKYNAHVFKNPTTGAYVVVTPEGLINTNVFNSVFNGKLVTDAAGTRYVPYTGISKEQIEQNKRIAEQKAQTAASLKLRATYSKVMADAVRSGAYKRDPVLRELIIKNYPHLKNTIEAQSIEYGPWTAQALGTGILLEKEGGVLKAASGTQIKYGGNKVDLSIKPKKAGELPYGKIDTSGSDWRFDKSGEYTSEYTNAINNLTPEWFNLNKDAIQKKITESGSTFKLQSLDQLKKLATDKHPGLLHDIIATELPTSTTDPAKTEESKIANNPPAEADADATGGLEVDKRKNALESLKSKLSINPKTIGNLALYGYIRSKNAKVADLTRQAVLAGAVTLPGMSPEYVRITSPEQIVANAQADAVRSKAGRLASSTSDLDKSTAISLEGTSKAANIETAAAATAQEKLEALRNKQRELNYTTNKYNLGVEGENKLRMAGVEKKLGQVGINKELSDATATTNLTHALLSTIEEDKVNKGLSAMYKAYTDPKYTKAREEYSNIVSEEGIAPFKAKYDKLKKNPDYKKEWEESAPYREWLASKSSKLKYLQELSKTAEQIQLAMTYRQPLPTFKSGGDVSKLDVEREKSERERKIKNVEMTYKAIIHNNEMLQRALIKIFK